MRILKEYVFNNLHWKCLSLLLAAVLWLVCINVVNPVVTRAYISRLTIKNLDAVEANGYVLLNKDEIENQMVNISIRGASDIFQNITSANFQPYIDISPINYLDERAAQARQPVNIHIERTGGAAGSAFSPVSVETTPLVAYINLDKVTDVTRPISVNITGTPQESYSAAFGVTTPETVKITGASTMLNRIARVEVDADIDGASGNVFQTAQVRVIDIDGRDITAQLQLDRRSVEVMVPIEMSARIPVRYNVTGEPAFGFELITVEQDIEYIDIIGQEEDIKKAAYISLPDIDITGVRETAVYAVDVRPELSKVSLSLANGAANEVNITVVVEAHVERELLLSINEPNTLIGLGEDLILEPFIIGLTVAGRAADMRDFDPGADVSVTLDVTGLSAGRHSVPITITLPEGVYQKSERIPAVIEITAPEPEEEEPEETAEPPEE